MNENKIILSIKEVKRIYELMEKINKSDQWNSVELVSESCSGIGSILTATFNVTHKDVEGSFKVSITDESNW
jgi:hypothetical protein